MTNEEAIKRITTWLYAAPDVPPMQVVQALELAVDALRAGGKDMNVPTIHMTNADSIRAMSDEELAKFIFEMQKAMCVRFAEIFDFSKEELNFSDDAPDLLNWLRQKSEED